MSHGLAVEGCGGVVEKSRVSSPESLVATNFSSGLTRAYVLHSIVELRASVGTGRSVTIVLARRMVPVPSVPHSRGKLGLLDPGSPDLRDWLSRRQRDPVSALPSPSLPPSWLG